MPADTPNDSGRRRYESLQAVSERIGVNVKTIRRWIETGDLTAYRAGPRLLRLDVTEVDRLLRRVPTAGRGSSDAA